jgi:hypothetical protein
MPALREGGFQPLWCDSPASGEDDGVFAFARPAGAAVPPVVVAFNASATARRTAAGANRMRLGGSGGSLLFSAGSKLQLLRPLAPGAVAVSLIMPEDGRLALEVPPGEVVVLRAAPEQ